MRTALAVCLLIGCATIAQGQEESSPYPLYRSPNQKQADYLRSQAARRYVAPTVTIRQPGYYGYGYGVPYDYRYGSPYGYYGRYRRARYPIYPIYPPRIQTWPVTPYPFRIP